MPGKYVLLSVSLINWVVIWSNFQAWINSLEAWIKNYAHCKIQCFLSTRYLEWLTLKYLNFFTIFQRFDKPQLTYLFPIQPFSTLVRHQKILLFSDVFRGVEKGCIGNKWVQNPVIKIIIIMTMIIIIVIIIILITFVHLNCYHLEKFLSSTLQLENITGQEYEQCPLKLTKRY